MKKIECIILPFKLAEVKKDSGVWVFGTLRPIVGLSVSVGMLNYTTVVDTGLNLIQN